MDEDSSKLKQNSNLLILGAGGHGRVVRETAEAMKCFNKIDFLDDNKESGIAIGLCKDYKEYINKYSYAFPAFGNNELRMEWLNTLMNAGFQIPTLIYPNAFISPGAKIAEGSIVGAKAAVNTNAVIERGCIISIGAIIDHECIVREGCHINAGAIVKANSTVDKLSKVEAGKVYDGEENLSRYCSKDIERGYVDGIYKV